MTYYSVVYYIICYEERAKLMDVKHAMLVQRRAAERCMGLSSIISCYKGKNTCRCFAPQSFLKMYVCISTLFAESVATLLGRSAQQLRSKSPSAGRPLPGTTATTCSPTTARRWRSRGRRSRSGRPSRQLSEEHSIGFATPSWRLN